MLRLNELIAVIKMKEALAECPRNPTRTDYVLTLADGRTVDVVLAPCGDASWCSEVPRGQVDCEDYSVSRDSFGGVLSFGVALAAACQHAERQSKSHVVCVEPKTPREPG